MNRRKIFTVPGLLMLGTALVSFSPLAADAQAVNGTNAQVTIDNFTFSPATLTVSAGTKVTWTNRDDMPHTVTDNDHPKEIRSPALDTGDTYSRTFTAPGIYRYFCSLHPHMQGTVVVK